MNLFIQFPLCDLRSFVSSGTGKLPRPGWPLPYEDEFIRSFGKIRRRVKEGIELFEESSLCVCDKVLGVLDEQNFDIRRDLSVNLSIKFSSLYCDQFALTKFELVIRISSDQRIALSPDETGRLVRFILNRRLSVCGVTTKVVDIGGVLRDRYLRSTTSHQFQPQDIRADWIQPLKPLLYIEASTKERVSGPGKGEEIKFSEGSPYRLGNFNFQRGSKGSLPLWICEKVGMKCRVPSRHLRLLIMRQFAEYSVLRWVMHEIATAKICPAPRSDAAESLQRYIQKSHNRLKKNCKKIDNSWVIDRTRISEWRIYGESRKALYEKLKDEIAIRPQIFYKIQKLVEEMEDESEKQNFGNITARDVIIAGGNLKIRHSFNDAIDLASSKDVKLALGDFKKAIENMVTSVDPAIADGFLRDCETFAQEAAAEQPRIGRMKETASSITSVAKTVTTLGAPVIKLVNSIIGIFG